jgi:acyl-coenzyme A synthetase/AMP-(fatty) acid ligase
VRSALIASAYLWDEALTARHFSDGWFLMSDLGALLAADKLLVFGRSDDMLNIGGVKTAPYPIEELLRVLPGVADAVVLRVETAAGGGMMCAMIELAQEAVWTDVLSHISDVMRTLAATFMVQQEAEFPRTDTGKVRRSMLQMRADAKVRELDREQRPDQRAAPEPARV